MDNINLLPTDKPTGIFKSGDNLLFSITDKVRTTNEGFYIYITSDEEIKVGDWCINLNSPYPHKELCRIDNHLELERYAKKTGNDCKKIILTTDQDLIKDGVQAIDDEFLEWFVKNPSCEEVEVVGDDCYYEIIIPKEEPKTNLEKLPFPKLVEEFANYYKKVPLVEEPKQETLEEAAENYVKNESDATLKLISKYSFTWDGAKWNQERMYSEAIEFGKWLDENMQQREYYPMSAMTMEELFEQFKKK